ncbi:ABC transporter permease [Paracoccus sp. IB05]|uniref:ABC transporter permease n=1 Tax=Paracoccus sp. IB05 TaxID=2779367 RepID=UPI0018E728C4|nr:ABC transporter permease [Paracoccus sp. IB05]MBJ2151833.1 ABC transporter permease [Paracoccus sp. IB05]
MSRKTMVGGATILAALTLWYLLTTVLGVISPGRFPSPADTWTALAQVSGKGYANGVLGEHILRSVMLVSLGFIVAVATGVPLGLWMGWSRRAEAVINPVFLVIRPIPPLAWIPLAILWLGLGDLAKILVIWFAAFVPSVINSYAGVRNLDRTLIEAARMLGTPFTTFVREILLPGASPMIFTGLRLSLQASWTTLVAAELVGAMTGLGRVLNAAQQDLYPGMILVGMIAVTICGWLMTVALGVAEKRALAWNTAAQAGG